MNNCLIIILILTIVVTVLLMIENTNSKQQNEKYLVNNEKYSVSNDINYLQSKSYTYNHPDLNSQLQKHLDLNEKDENEIENQKNPFPEKLKSIDMIPQVPLNYFTLDEPKYFFYDPNVAYDYEIGKSNLNIHEQLGDEKEVYLKTLKDSQLFGLKNYLRYYIGLTD